MVQALTKHWLNKPHRLRRLCFSIYAQRCPSFVMPTYNEKIYLHAMHIHAFATLTDIATIMYNNGTRRTNSLLEHRWCFTIWSFHLQNCSSQISPKLRERINIHLAVMRSILCNSERKPSWTRQRTRLRSNTIYEFAAQFTNASYMVANRYSFKPTSNNQKDGTSNEKKHEHQPDKNKHDQQIHYRGKWEEKWSR